MDTQLALFDEPAALPAITPREHERVLRTIREMLAEASRAACRPIRREQLRAAAYTRLDEAVELATRLPVAYRADADWHMGHLRAQCDGLPQTNLAFDF